jgi:hypothetical protein
VVSDTGAIFLVNKNGSAKERETKAGRVLEEYHDINDDVWQWKSNGMDEKKYFWQRDADDKKKTVDDILSELLHDGVKLFFQETTDDSTTFDEDDALLSATSDENLAGFEALDRLTTAAMLKSVQWDQK